MAAALLTTDAIAHAIRRWHEHARYDPVDAERLLRQPAYFLVLPAAPPQFLPLRHLIANIAGIPFSQKSGRSINMAVHQAELIRMGLARVTETSPFFDTIWTEWAEQCRATGKPLAAYEGCDPRTGREFWKAPYPFPNCN